MAKYDRRMDALRQGEFLPLTDDTYDPVADMRALTGAHKRKASEKDSYMSTEQLEELRKVQNERVQVSALVQYHNEQPLITFTGEQDEAAWHGHQADYGSPHGWDVF